MTRRSCTPTRLATGARDAMARARASTSLLLSLGADLPWLTGYEAMPLERLTMLVAAIATAKPRSWCPGSRRRVSSSSPTCSRSGRGTRPTTRRHRRRPRRRGAHALAIGDHDVGARSSSSCRQRLPATAFGTVGRRHRPAAGGEGRRRGRRPARRRRGGRPGGDRSCTAATSRSSGAPRPRCRPSIGRAPAGRGPSTSVNFAIVGGGPQLGQPPPRRRARASSRSGEVVLCDFGGTLRRLLLRHHPHACPPAQPPAEFRDAYDVLLAGAGRGGAGRHRGHAVRRRRRRRPPHHHRRRLRRALHPPHRPRHRRRGARGPLHRRGQRRAARARATPSRSSPGSTCQASSACASRTSWWRRPTGPTR